MRNCNKRYFAIMECMSVIRSGGTVAFITKKTKKELKQELRLYTSISGLKIKRKKGGFAVKLKNK